MTALGLLGVAPNNDVAFVLQIAALGALVGSAVAAAMRLRNPEADTWLPTALGGLRGAVGAAGWVLWEAIS